MKEKVREQATEETLRLVFKNTVRYVIKKRMKYKVISTSSVMEEVEKYADENKNNIMLIPDCLETLSRAWMIRAVSNEIRGIKRKNL